MGYVVLRTDGMAKDSEFETYARLLRGQGVDLGKLPRAPDPSTGNRWLYVWDEESKAKKFAAELQSASGDNAWTVSEVGAPASEGPLGPVIIQLGRRSNGIVFGIHPLSRKLLRSLYPDSSDVSNTMSINFDNWYDFQKTHGTIEDLTDAVLPSLTGISIEELKKIGYTVIEDETDRTVIYVKPGDLIDQEISH